MRRVAEKWLLQGKKAVQVVHSKESDRKLRRTAEESHEVICSEKKEKTNLRQLIPAPSTITRRRERPFHCQK
jgi:hypothetical protein